MTVTRMVITISREEGSGGRAIAQELAKSLKLSYVDNHVIKTAAKHLNIPEEDLAQFDEKILPRLGEMRQLLNKSSDLSLSEVLSPERDAFGLVKPRNPAQILYPGEEDKQQAILRGYHVLVERLIKEVAAAGNVVIVGRGSNFILKGWQGVTNVLIHAPLQERLERWAYLHRSDKDVAAQEVVRLDQMRGDYVRHYYDADWLNPDNYHLIINTAGLPLSVAASAISHFVRDSQHSHISDPLELHRTYDRLIDQDNYSVKEAAAVLLTDPDVIRQAVYRGELKATMVNHNVASISREALVDWVHRSRSR